MGLRRKRMEWRQIVDEATKKVPLLVEQMEQVDRRPFEGSDRNQIVPMILHLLFPESADLLGTLTKREQFRVISVVWHVWRKAIKTYPPINREFRNLLEPLACQRKQIGRHLANWLQSGITQALLLDSRNGWYLATKTDTKIRLVPEEWIQYFGKLEFVKAEGDDTLYRLSEAATTSLKLSRNNFFDDHPECSAIWCA